MKKSQEINLIPVNNSFYITSDCLNLINGNRPLTKPKSIKSIKNIERAMLEGKFIKPIIVNVIVDENGNKCYELADGQHRNAAACNLWRRGIEYKLNVILSNEESSLDLAIHLNEGKLEWGHEDYVRAHVSKGNENFILFEKFIREHSIFVTKYSTNYLGAAQLLTGAACKGVIKNGTLRVTKSQCKEADVICKELETLIKITGNGLVARGHILAYVEERKYIKNFDKFVKAMKKRFVIPKYSTKTAWREALRDVINTLK